jgi:SAM-dependent methyltransferase
MTTLATGYGRVHSLDRRSQGLPGFYLRAANLGERLALDGLLRPGPGERWLDVGCGVGAWSRILAGRGAAVTGIDPSPTLVREARRRASADGLGPRCRFEVAELASLDLAERFDSVLAVKALEPIREPERLFDTVLRLRSHVKPGGRVILLEAAPSRPTSPYDAGPQEVRSLESYLQLFRDTSLRLESLRGVDPAPFRTLVEPYCAKLPRPVALLSLAALTVASLPWDLLLGRVLVGASWHKVFVLTPDDEDPCAPA